MQMYLELSAFDCSQFPPVEYKVGLLWRRNQGIARQRVEYEARRMTTQKSDVC